MPRRSSRQDDDLRAALFPDSDDSFTTATCAEPENQDEGTTFACTATDTTGATWEFEIVITGSSEYEVNVARRPVELLTRARTRRRPPSRR